MSENIAIIPARSGSKGLPGKNIKMLHGKPLLAYTIQAAKEANLFDKIIVSTDSESYRKIAQEYGAEVPFLRHAALADDTASTWDVVIDVLQWYKEEQAMEFCKVCVLQPTSPLRDGEDIRKTFNLMNEKQAKSIISVCPTDHPSHIINTLPEDLSLYQFVQMGDERQRRQDINQTYRINGAIYLRNVKDVLVKAPIYTKDSYAYIMSKEHSIDIDDELDFLLADIIIRRKKNMYDN